MKKNQTQLMKERLARTRLEEYENRQRTQDQLQPPSALSTKRMPLGKITNGILLIDRRIDIKGGLTNWLIGAAALEIVDDFIKSPFMDKFGSDVIVTSSSPVKR